MTTADAAPTLERDDRGWWVRCRDGQGRAARVGPFESKGAAWTFMLRTAGFLVKEQGR